MKVTCSRCGQEISEEKLFSHLANLHRLEGDEALRIANEDIKKADVKKKIATTGEIKMVEIPFDSFSDKKLKKVMDDLSEEDLIKTLSALSEEEQKRLLKRWGGLKKRKEKTKEETEKIEAKVTEEEETPGVSDTLKEQRDPVWDDKERRKINLYRLYPPFFSPVERRKPVKKKEKEID